MRIKAAITIIALAICTACPLSEAGHPTRDDTSQPADGGGECPVCECEAAATETGAEKPAVIEVEPVKASK